MQDQLFCYRIEDSPGSFYYVARSKEDALSIHQTQNGLTDDEITEESSFVELVDDDYELTIQTDVTEDSKETRTVSEWIKKEGRGNLTVPGWLMN